MRHIRQRDTAPELALRRVLHADGIRFRVCPSDLPGRPDLANKRRRWAVFVHGCFWHGHEGCPKATVPKTNAAFWVEKLNGNRARDERKQHALEELGYLVLTVWECELRDPAGLSRLTRTLARRKPLKIGKAGRDEPAAGRQPTALGRRRRRVRAQKAGTRFSRTTTNKTVARLV